VVKTKCGMYVYTTGPFYTLKRNEILIYATTWVNFEGIMLSEVSQTQKDKYGILPVI